MHCLLPTICDEDCGSPYLSRPMKSELRQEALLGICDVSKNSKSQSAYYKNNLLVALKTATSYIYTRPLSETTLILVQFPLMLMTLLQSQWITILARKGWERIIIH